ncbi:hypothetical protein GQ42DRAFT_136035 [Ramicandelaber brevisporus]|nr:hypothetical protein GQ42DRAFT_136035 [Ramicandelaber brevisporus]
MQQLNQEECMVYQRIKDCGNMGIWVRHLSRDTNLPAPKIAQCIKTLELRSIIKLVKNVKYPARKTYMLANIQPSVELTGGAFYTDDDLDEEFIQQLANYAYNIVLQYSFPPTTSSRSGINTGAYDKLAVFGPGLARYPTAADVHRKIINSGIVANPDDLATDDIRSILEMLVFDGRLERLMPDPSMAVLNYMYRALRSTAAIGRRSITEMPCGKCPVYSKCGDDSLVSPVTCEYMANWLELEY